MARLIAIGDIHGEIEKLNSLLEKINPQKGDKFVFLGDYIDRGNNSKEVINTLIELSKSFECIFLKGNHEDMMLKIAETNKQEDVEHWLLAGGITTYDNYGGYPEIFNLHSEFFDNLKLYHIENGYLFVHAGVKPDKQTIEEQTEDDLLWIREEFISKPHKLPYIVIFGHTPFVEPFIEKNKIGIDTGCGKDSKYNLTAFICDDKTFITSDF
ncbi:serine/threonine protein phosphatase [bacterium]|nr:serine/threonine protein phosphatase [bacterium]